MSSVAARQQRPALIRWPLRIGLTGLLTATCALFAPVLSAASLQVAPILLEFPADEQAQGLWLSNTGQAPIRAQVRVMQWSQTDGSDQLTPTRELLASPPILEIAPGQRQLVRIIRPQPQAPGSELSYRLLVDELPDAEAESNGGLQFLLRYSVPVFVLQPGRTPAIAAIGPHQPYDTSPLSARIADGTLEVANGGNTRARISQLSYVNRDGSRVSLVPGLVGYVLAGQRMQWPLELPDTVRPGGAFKAMFNNDREEQILPLPETTP
ncbi:hypothetical protein CSC70_12975 [Pseudoxanthomonas kalamensis DSM 18571]|uniref:fimbrial biogenesis chaperone n=1 Tax=Pseudoxanthomonas kalamensis TaxID=289483 RepID=UPI0013917AB7|nr:molecular chaperone [Pseudoxanthomonas kalamensis]KAF1708552.1 hypothetical protein CSC70_12975 [Pseudoxanthomonas kalamensis DSM 18571]